MFLIAYDAKVVKKEDNVINLGFFWYEVGWLWYEVYASHEDYASITSILDNAYSFLEVSALSKNLIDTPFLKNRTTLYQN